jgi:hypothetical protein
MAIDFATLVPAVEAAYARGDIPGGDAAHRAAAAAVASRFLAVGTPYSIGLVLGPELAALALAAHRVWFAPRDLRCTDPRAAAALGGRHVSLAEACACDIVCAFEVAILSKWIRRGTHVNARDVMLDRELATAARVVDDRGLVEIAAGRVDGRSLDEITIYQCQI